MIDIGANLADSSFDDDRAAVLERARAAGVSHIVITGSSFASNALAAEMAASDPSLLSHTAGLHPHYATHWNAELAAQITALDARSSLRAFGECGLDYFRDLSPRADQRAAFIAQLEIAAAANKPVFLHQREAHADFLAILRDFRAQLPRCVVHCFTDTGDALDQYLELDCHIGITGWICDERRGGELRSIVERIPDDRLMVETDAPYLLPRSIRPKPRSRRCEPMHLPYVIAALAECRGQSAEAVSAMTTANAQAFFGLIDA